MAWMHYPLLNLKMYRKVRDTYTFYNFSDVEKCQTEGFD